MFSRFAKPARAVVVGAESEARTAGSHTIEAEHLLLAITREAGTAAQRELAATGLDHEALGEALEREREQSLLTAGVSASSFGARPATADPARRIRMGNSAKLVFQRALRVAGAHGSRTLEPTHLLLGVLRAEVGTVPRALEVAGVDRVLLTTRAEQALDAG